MPMTRGISSVTSGTGRSGGACATITSTNDFGFTAVSASGVWSTTVPGRARVVSTGRDWICSPRLANTSVACSTLMPSTRGTRTTGIGTVLRPTVQCRSATATNDRHRHPGAHRAAGRRLVADDHAGLLIPCRLVARDQLQLQPPHLRMLLRRLEGLADEIRHPLRLHRICVRARSDLRRRLRDRRSPRACAAASVPLKASRMPITSPARRVLIGGLQGITPPSWKTKVSRILIGRLS